MKRRDFLKGLAITACSPAVLARVCDPPTIEDEVAVVWRSVNGGGYLYSKDLSDIVRKADEPMLGRYEGIRFYDGMFSVPF